MRPARQFRYSVPSRAELTARIERLIRAELSRAEASDWAAEFLLYDDPQIYPEISDEAVWCALKQLSGADLLVSERVYLHDENDFASWLAELRAAD